MSNLKMFNPNAESDRQDGQPIDTIWFDVSVLMLLPPGYIAGIPRTVKKIFRVWQQQPWANIRFCAIVPDIGLAEVDPNFILPEENRPKPKAKAKAKPAPAPEPVPLPMPIPVPMPESVSRRSRFWYLPWGVRHRLRSAGKGVKNLWVDPNLAHSVAPPAPVPVLAVPEPELPPPPPEPRVHYPPYKPDSIIRLLDDLGPNDLVFSLGGLWTVPNVSRTLTAAKERQNFQFVSLIYDLIPLFAPHYCSPSHVLSTFVPANEMQLRESDVLLTISEYSKLDIVKYAQQEYLPIGPVDVFTLGSDIRPMDAAVAASTPQQHRRPYVLTVGSVEVRKNHYGMYMAWRKLIKTHGPDNVPDLVIAGKPGWHGDSILYLIQSDPLVKNKIIVKAGPTDKELDWLYKHCLFTLYPSLYEGWGLPVEESLIYGKVCVTTTATSLPEVGREFADYVEPEETDAIVQGVLRAMDPEYRREREALIREKFRPNTWEESAAQLQAILQSRYQIEVEEPVPEPAAPPAPVAPPAPPVAEAPAASKSSVWRRLGRSAASVFFLG